MYKKILSLTMLDIMEKLVFGFMFLLLAFIFVMIIYPVFSKGTPDYCYMDSYMGPWGDQPAKYRVVNHVPFDKDRIVFETSSFDDANKLAKSMNCK